MINGVIGYGEHNGIIRILIDEEGDVCETRNKIAEALRSDSFSCKTVSTTVRHLHYHPSAKIKLFSMQKKDSYGTLGGFLKAENSPDNSTLYAVTAGHVSKNANGILRIEENEECFGQFLGEWDSAVHEKDINIAKIFEEHRNKFDKKLRDDNDVPKLCVVLDLESEENERLVPELIYIKGATSGISLGEIHTVKFFAEGAHANCMLAQDRKGENKPFCKPGDSGSLVCFNDRRGNFVNVIGMVIGKYASSDDKNRGYLVYHFQSGLNHLNKKYQEEGPFELCELYRE